MNEMYEAKKVIQVETNYAGNENYIAEWDIVCTSAKKDCVVISKTISNKRVHFFITKRKNGKWIYEGYNINCNVHFIPKKD